MTTAEPTPRTDAMINQVSAAEFIRFARQLERELTAALAEVERLTERLAYRDKVKGTFCDSCPSWEQMAFDATNDAQDALARAEAAERDAIILAEAAYSTCCGANGIYDNTWRTADGREVVPDFPHSGFPEAISRLGEAIQPFMEKVRAKRAAIDAMVK